MATVTPFARTPALAALRALDPGYGIDTRDGRHEHLVVC